MLSDIKELAETVGREVLGFEIEWLVETTAATIGKRPDVEIRMAAGNRDLIASGEAKRPEVAEGIHPFVAGEVRGAIAKARSLRSPLAFTTNFIQIAIFDPTVPDSGSYLDALVGTEPVEWVPEQETATSDWWSSLSRDRREALLRPGLEAFFARLRAIRAQGQQPSKISTDEVYLSIFKASADGIVTAAFPAFTDAISNLALPAAVAAEAKARDFDLSKADVARYFVAQAVAEVLTSGLFYQTVRPNFSLREILSGLRPASSKLLLETLIKNLDEATRVTGDYETIFGLSEAARWVLGVESDHLRALWIGLFDALAGVKFEEVTSDIIGVIFERLISAERRQDMGQHYTQSRLARAMTAWGVNNEDDLIVDFCAGGGTFLVEAYNRLRADKAHERVLEQVFGNDLDSFAVHLSTVNLATRDVYKGHNFPAVSNRDALEIRPGTAAVDVTPKAGEAYRLDYPNKFNVVLGNPPYDESADDPERYRRDLAELAGQGGLSVLPKGLPNNINLAGWFILLAAAWLKPGGRIALVLPASILQNDKHATLLNWLRSRFDVTIWHTEADIWFSDARVAPFALLATPRVDTAADFGSLSFVNVHEPIQGSLATDQSAVPVPSERTTIRDLQALPPESDIIISGTLPAALAAFESAANAKRLGDFASVASGNKLGHEFYRLEERDRASSGVLRQLRGFAIPTKLHSKYLVPLLDAPRDAPTGEFNESAARWYVLAAPKDLPKGGELEKYVQAVRRTGVHEKPSVKNRGKSWWSVAWKKSRIAVAIHPQFQHQVWWANEPYVAKNNMHTVAFAATVSRDDEELVAAALSSAFGALSALYRSGEVGCEGVRWLSTGQLNDWFVLNPSAVGVEQRAAVLGAYREYRVLKTAKLFELPNATKAAWRKLTVEVAKAAGMPDAEAAADDALKEAHDTTFRRREREILATSGRTRAGSTGGGKLMRDIKNFTETHADFATAVAALSDGTDTVRLRTETVEETLFDLEGETEKRRVGNALTAILGSDFEAAPVWEEATVDAVEAIQAVVRGHFIELDDTGSVPAGYEQTAATLRESVVKSLQVAVRKRLS